MLLGEHIFGRKRSGWIKYLIYIAWACQVKMAGYTHFTNKVAHDPRISSILIKVFYI